MVRYLLRHPISVLMSFLAMAIVGTYMFMALPVTLLPDIDIPEITLKVASGGMSANETEATVVTPLRRSLLQTGGLKEIISHTSDGGATISMKFRHGIDTDLSFIEVNEKIDAAMSSLPRSIPRPKAVKSNTTDIPVVYIHMSLKETSSDDGGVKFAELAQLADNVVRRRIEQLSSIAMVDMTGLPVSSINVVADIGKMERLGVALEEIESAIMRANLNDVSLKVNDKQYIYDLRIDNSLYSADDISSLKIKKGGRLYSLGELCVIEKGESAPQGFALASDRRTITLAVVEKGQERVGGVGEELRTVLEDLSARYPDIEFTQSQNQDEFLTMTITNLVQNLLLGLILVFILTMIFIGNTRLSVVIGLSVIVSLIVSMSAFYLFGVTLNIISLSGLILAVGMMIDNSTIVSENIIRLKEQGLKWEEACDKGATEMITPLLSSMLTTIAVFLPLVFISGIGGALFADQAFSISAGLIASYVISIILVPVIVLLTQGKESSRRRGNNSWLQHRSKKINDGMLRAYEKIMLKMMKHPKSTVVAAAAVALLCWPAARLVDLEMLPPITRTDAIAVVDWGKNINAEENARRVSLICREVESQGLVVQTTANVGRQDFMLGTGPEMSQRQSTIYFKCRSADQLEKAKRFIEGQISQVDKASAVTYTDPANVFTKVFDTSMPLFEVRLSKNGEQLFGYDESVNQISKEIAAATSAKLKAVPSDSILAIRINRESLDKYGIPYSELVKALVAALGTSNIGMLQSSSEQLPVQVSLKADDLHSALERTSVRGIGVRNFISLEVRPVLKEITSSTHGQYIPIEVIPSSDPDEFYRSLQQFARQCQSSWSIDCVGTYFESRGMMIQMIAILGISILLMYFILCSQFENFLQPLIVLAEIPIDMTFVFLIMWVFGVSLNIMSAIGIIVTCGIIVNDSILKITSINSYRKQGYSIDDAIHTAGVRRLRPIIVTSLTTVFAMVPTLMSNDMGSELQKPMAVAIIGSMTVGTMISLFVVPIIYRCIYKLKRL